MGGQKINFKNKKYSKSLDTVLIDRIPPQNIEAEMAVLGAMLLEDDAISNVVDILAEGSFYKDKHRKIFSCILKLYVENSPVDLVTLTEQLTKENNLEQIGGPAYLTELIGVVPTAANVIHYAKIVQEKSLLRNLITTSTNIISEGYEPDQEVDLLLDKAETLIFEISNAKMKGGFVPIKQLVKSSIENIEKVYQQKSQITGVATGYADLDYMTAGFQNSDLIILAGRPSMGKSALMCGFAEHSGLQSKIPTAIFSLEMSKESLTQRMLCSYARVNMQGVRTGFLSQTHWKNLVNAAAEISQASIFIDDTPGINVLELRAKARRLKSQYDIGLIILDYLQLMSAVSPTQSRQQEISDISRALKALARELNVPLIAVSQLSRAAEQREGNRPRLSDLRDSGAIEQDADLVMLLFREEYYNPSEDNKGLADLIIAKQRNGPVGTKKMIFLKEFSRFEDLSGEKNSEL
ncbi:MAG: replicative DNA helicase [Candidatus Omnitrophota bacterium]|nr:MAG: replicative DNA helicase [Candidatus Omnitrophota bacterium]